MNQSILFGIANFPPTIYFQNSSKVDQYIFNIFGNTDYDSFDGELYQAIGEKTDKTCACHVDNVFHCRGNEPDYLYVGR